MASKLRLGDQCPGLPLPPSTTPNPTTTIPAAWPAAAGVEQAGPAALLAAARQRQVPTVLEPRTVNAGPAVEVVAAPAGRPSRRQAQHATFTVAVPSGAAPRAREQPSPAVPGAGSPTPQRSTLGSEGKASRHRVSAQENASGDDSHAGSPTPKPQPAAVAGLPQDCTSAAPSMLSVATHRGFQAAALQRGKAQCSMLRTKRSLWREVQAALRRGALREAIRLLEDSQGE